MKRDTVHNFSDGGYSYIRFLIFCIDSLFSNQFQLTESKRMCQVFAYRNFFLMAYNRRKGVSPFYGPDRILRRQ